MDNESVIQAASEEVMKKIGRNLLSFQMAEQILKELLRLGGLATRSGAPDETFGEMAKRVQTMTLGGLTTLFTETHCSNKAQVFPRLPENSDEVMIAMSFSFDYGENGLAERRASLASLVAERNKLVHHLLPEFDRDSLESCRATAADLDRQRELVLPEIKRLQEDYRSIRQELSNLAALMSSPVGLNILSVSPLQHHPLVKEFVNIAQTNPSSDEWISLNSAAGSITGFSRDEITEICANFGYKSLTALMIASQRFEIDLEPTANDRHRVLYRLKQDASMAEGLSSR